MRPIPRRALPSTILSLFLAHLRFLHRLFLIVGRPILHRLFLIVGHPTVISDPQLRVGLTVAGSDSIKTARYPARLPSQTTKFHVGGIVRVVRWSGGPVADGLEPEVVFGGVLVTDLGLLLRETLLGVVKRLDLVDIEDGVGGIGDEAVVRSLRVELRDNGVA